MEKENNTLKNLQKNVESFCKEKGWDKLSPTEKYLLFSEETGELAKAIRKHINLFGERNKKSKENLGEEMADTLSYLLDLANTFDIDLEEALFKKQTTNKKRF